ncbi:hypothetical protein PR048_004736 [Dryococelus australis]|uniref:Uncharacterized protein n=1 Tax=Dryococelus australis TaxID=614101 RepID=A0ABQ9I676_9NEOP|nr:hypothetical protein PR048_004736 [Dryococelus australis]
MNTEWCIHLHHLPIAVYFHHDLVWDDEHPAVKHLNDIHSEHVEMGKGDDVLQAPMHSGTGLFNY